MADCLDRASLRATRAAAGTTLLALLLLPASARAEGIAGRVSIGLQAGTQVELGGRALHGVSGTLLGRDASTVAKPYRDLYRAGVRLDALLGYGLTRHLELTLRGFRNAPRAAALDAGRVAGRRLRLCLEPEGGAADASCGEASFHEYGLELGLRLYISPQSRLKAYVAAAGGLRHAEEQLVTLSLPDVGAAVLHVPVGRGGFVPVWGADLGIVAELTPRVFLGLDTGVRREPAREGFLALPELGAFDRRTPRWTAPVGVAIGLRF
jgi:hypothetical protein